MSCSRAAAWLAGMWAGALWGIGLIGAPAGFAVTLPQTAGRVAGRMFAQEAYLSVVVAITLLLLLRRQAHAAARTGKGSVLSADMLLVLGTLFCTSAGYFAIQPMMVAARGGEAMWSFGALHGLSAGLYALKAVLAMALAWRLTAR